MIVAGGGSQYVYNIVTLFAGFAQICSTRGGGARA